MIKRAIFSLCRAKIKRDKNQQKAICEPGASKDVEIIIEEKMAIIDEIEEIRNRQNDRIQKQITKDPTKTSSANKTAIAVATPLPPLKLR